VVARFVNHVWMMDVTVIQTFLGGEVHLAGVFDALSRVPLALQSFGRKPGAGAMARLLKTAVRAFGVPKYLITDLGTEFTGNVFRKAVAPFSPSIAACAPLPTRIAGLPHRAPREASAPLESFAACRRADRRVPARLAALHATGTPWGTTRSMKRRPPGAAPATTSSADQQAP
jgi:hypothetical protein